MFGFWILKIWNPNAKLFSAVRIYLCPTEEKSNFEYCHILLERYRNIVRAYARRVASFSFMLKVKVFARKYADKHIETRGKSIKNLHK